jgi:hypothetical protein
MADQKDKNLKKRYPDWPYDPKYPYNHVRVSEAGELHFDDTEKNERIRLVHMSGTGVTIGGEKDKSDQGHMMTKVVGNHTTYVKGGSTVTVDKNADNKFHGSVRNNISGDHHTETKGSVTSATGGNVKAIVGGDSVTAVKGDSVHGVTGKTVFKIGKGIQLKGDSTFQTKIDGDASLEFAKTLLLKALNGMTLDGGPKITIKAGTIVLESSDIRLGSENASDKIVKEGVGTPPTQVSVSTVAKAK